MDYFYFGILYAITSLKSLRGGQIFYYSVSKTSQSTCKAEICFHVYEKIKIFSLYFKSHVKLNYILRIVTYALVVWFVSHWAAVIKEWKGRKQQFSQGVMPWSAWGAEGEDIWFTPASGQEKQENAQFVK